MAKIKLRDWIEPAHPVLVQRFEDLVELYRFLRKDFQERIDKVFDGVSRQIGFVVTTTLPIALQMSREGKIEKVELAGESLRGTIFEREFGGLLKEMCGRQAGNIAAGSYSVYLLWHEALRLKLKTDWIEPAHYRQFQRVSSQAAAAEELASQISPGVREPAHWFDAGIALDREEEVLIAAIDEVYTDLKLAERIAMARREGLRYVPGIREPAHFRKFIDEIIEARAERKLVPGIREPAHFRRIEELLEREEGVQLIAELYAVMKKYGL